MVNGQRITRQELADECLNRHGTEVLESLVNKHLIWQACQKQGITINSDDVEAEISRLAGKFGLSAGRWLTLLRDERGITPEQYRREIIWPTLALRSLAERQIEVTPQELQQAFESEYGPRVKARADTVSSQQRAEQLRHRPPRTLTISELWPKSTPRIRARACTASSHRSANTWEMKTWNASRLG